MGRTSRTGKLRRSSSLVQETEGDPPVDLNDMAAVQHGLNGAASEAVMSAGYRENFGVSNTRIALGLLTCSWALLAQFYPKKYPANIPILVFCLVAYGVCTIVLNVYLAYKAGDSFFFASSQQSCHGGEVRLSSSLLRYSHMYKLTIHSADLSAAKSDAKSMEKSVTSYFDEDGFLARDVIHADATQLLQTFQKRNVKKVN